MKKVGSWFYRLIIGTLLLLLIATALLQTAFVREKVISILKDKLHEKMGYTITYTELKGSPPFFFAFTDLNISRSGEQLFFARQISISWAPWHLLAGGIVASHIDAHHVIIGSIEWEEHLPQELKSSSNPSYFAINDFHFSHFSQQVHRQGRICCFDCVKAPGFDDRKEGSINQYNPLCDRSNRGSFEASQNNKFDLDGVLDKSQKILESIDLKGSFSLNTEKDILYLRVSGVPTTKELPLPALTILTLEREKKNLSVHLQIFEKNHGLTTTYFDLQAPFEIDASLLISLPDDDASSYHGSFTSTATYLDEKIGLEGSFHSKEGTAWESKDLTFNLPGGIKGFGESFYNTSDRKIQSSLSLPHTFSISENFLGAFSAKLQIEGTLDSLQTQLNINGDTLKFNEHSLQNLSLEMKGNLSPAHLTGDGSIFLQGKYEEQPFSMESSYRWKEQKIDLRSWSLKSLKTQAEGEMSLAFEKKHQINFKLLLHRFFIPQFETSQGKLALSLLIDKESIHGEIQGKAVHIAALTNTTAFSGIVDLDIDLQSRWKAPFLTGSGTIQQGSYEDLETGALFSKIYGRLECEENKILIKSLEAFDSREGSIALSGQISLELEKKLPFLLNLNLNQALIIKQDYAEISASGPITYSGNYEQGMLQGNLQLDEAQIFVPEEKGSFLSHVDVVFVDNEGHPLQEKALLSPDDWPILLDLTLNIPQSVYINGQNLKSEWKGELKFSGTTDNPLVNGQIDLMKGEYDFRGRPFTMKKGKILFAGDPIKKSTLNISAEQQIEDIKVEITLRGPIKEPEIVLHSTPPLSKQEILSWILFNRGIADITPHEGEELHGTEITVSGGAGDDLLSRVRKSVGIDRVDINTSDKQGTSPYGANEVSLRIGKYISRGIFVSINKSINAEANQVAIEANLAKYWKIEGEVGDNAEGKLIIKWERDY